MRDYGKIAPQFWTGETGKKIRNAGTQAQLIACYLLTCPSATMLGLYYLPLPTLCHEVGCSLQGARKALQRLSQAEFAYYDAPSEYVYVPKMAQYQIAYELDPKDNRVAGIKKELQVLRNAPFFNDFLDRYRARFCLDDVSPCEAPPKALRSQEQEQEQEQEQKQEQDQEQDARPRWGVEELVTRWNGIPGAVPAEKVSGPVRETILRRLKEHPDPGWWDDLLRRIARSDFLCGRKTDFAATLDWCLGPTNLAKILAGNYENRAPVLVSQQTAGIEKFLRGGGGSHDPQ